MSAKAKIASTIVVAGVTLAAGSPFLMSFLEKWESSGNRVLVVYADKLAGGLPTVCDGLTRHVTSTPIIVGERWTDEKCDTEQRAAVVMVQHQLAPCIKWPVSQNTMDSLSSNSWNVGAPSTCKGRALSLINQGRLAEGCEALAHASDGRPVWSYANGKFVLGLYNRRLDEVEVCLKP